MKKSLCWLLIALVLCAVTGCSSGDTTETVEAEEIATTLTWQEQYDLGMKYLLDGNYEEAIIAFQAAIELEPKATASYMGRGEAYIGSGETEANLAAALADYQAAVTIDATEVLAYLGIADVYIRMGAYDLAMEILQQGLLTTDNASAIADKLAELQSGTISDSSNNVRLKSTYGAQTGELQEYTEYYYDEDGRQYMWYNYTYYDQDTMEYGDTVYLSNYCLVTFGEDNQIEAYHFYNEEDECTSWSSFVYNDQGLKTEQHSHSNDAEAGGKSFYFYYDASGQNTRYDKYYDGELFGYCELEYDENGIIVKETHYTLDGEVYSYSTTS